VTIISALDPTTPAEGSLMGNGRGELRAIKTALKDTFPTLSAAVTASAAEINALDDLVGDIATQLTAKADATHSHDGEAIGVVTLGDGARATTQPVGDDSTKIATTQFFQTALSTAGLGAAWTLVTSQAVTAAAAVELSLSGSFDHYRLISVGAQIASGTDYLLLQFGTASAWRTGGYYRANVRIGGTSSGLNTTGISLEGNDQCSAGAMSVVADLYSLGSATKLSRATARTFFAKGAVNPNTVISGGYYGTAEAHSRVRLIQTTGRFSGTFVVLGRRA